MKTPVTDLWSEYTFSLSSSIASGDIDDQAISEIYVWPRDLRITEEEKEDIKRFVHERLAEIVQRHGNLRLDQTIIASYIFRSFICGMMFSMQKGQNGNSSSPAS